VLNMADGIGDMKKDASGPTGPKRNLLKQTPPVNALRKYYNSEVPGAYRKNKTPSSRSPSMEPTDQIPMDLSRTNTINARTKSPIEPKEDITSRPVTPQHSTPPMTETTPHPN